MPNKLKYVHFEDTHNLRAPKEVVPFVINYVHPKSVIDVGCGLGTWLKIFKENGIHDYTGIEGSHIDKTKLVIPPDKIIVKDLEKPFALPRKFDLVISLEVAEHLKESSADDFIRSLTSLGNIILFSAAIPFQSGQNHINEQWPEYWREKFSKQGFYTHDVLREHFWNNENVDAWYSQNMFFYMHESLKEKYSPSYPNKQLPARIHPKLFIKIMHAYHPHAATFKKSFGNFLSALKKLLRK